MKVKCINIRETMPEQITVDLIYFADISQMFDDHGEWYFPVFFDKGFGSYVGNLKISHFTRVE